LKGRRAALVRTASVAGMFAVLAVGCGGASENAETPEQETVMVSAEKTPPADTTPPETTIDSGPTGTVNSGLISATVETDPVPHTGDAADDAAIWIDRRDRSLSIVIGTDKQGGLVVYDLSGRQIQYLPVGDVNNVDVRSDTDAGTSFVLGGEPVSLVTAGNRGDNSIGIYKVIADTRQLQDVAARVIKPGIRTYGSCMYRSPSSGKFYYFVNSKLGEVEQWELFDNGAGKVDAERVRSFDVGSQTEGCVADDQSGHLYIGEEDVGIRKYGAEPDAGAARTLVDSTGTAGHLAADVEGLTIAYGANGTGYLIASSQGNDSFVVYKREGNNDYVKTFKVSPGDGIDGVGGTDGIDVTTTDLGPDFPSGVFIAQDGTNDSGNQNFKLVPYQRIFP
jgi:3-phytase